MRKCKQFFHMRKCQAEVFYSNEKEHEVFKNI